MALDAIAVARAFEVMLPAAAAQSGLTIRRNPHREHLATIGAGVAKDTTVATSDYLRWHKDDIAFTGPLEQQKIDATGDLWVLEWTAPDALKPQKMAAASLPALAQWLQDNGLAFGS